MKIEDFTSEPHVLRAAELCESRGLRFLVDFGIENVFERLRELPEPTEEMQILLRLVDALPVPEGPEPSTRKPTEDDLSTDPDFSIRLYKDGDYQVATAYWKHGTYATREMALQSADAISKVKKKIEADFPDGGSLEAYYRRQREAMRKLTEAEKPITAEQAQELFRRIRALEIQVEYLSGDSQGPTWSAEKYPEEIREWEEYMEEIRKSLKGIKRKAKERKA